MENQNPTNPLESNNVNPTVDLPTASPENKTSLLLPILITLVISGVVFGLSGYYVGTQKITQQGSNQVANPVSNLQQPSPSPSAQAQPQTPENEEITYTNSQYGFSIQLPQGFTTQAEAAGAGTQEASQNARNFYVYKVGEVETYVNRYVNFEILGLTPSYPTQWTKTQATIAGKTATKLTDSSNTSSFDIYLISLEDDRSVIEIYVSNAPDKLITANQILSTLKFTN